MSFLRNLLKCENLEIAEFACFDDELQYIMNSHDYLALACMIANGKLNYQDCLDIINIACLAMSRVEVCLIECAIIIGFQKKFDKFENDSCTNGFILLRFSQTLQRIAANSANQKKADREREWQDFADHVYRFHDSIKFNGLIC